MKSLLVTFLFAGFAFNGCASNDFVVKEGQSGEKFTKDERECRIQVNEMMRSDRNMEDDRADTIRGVMDDQGQTQLPATMANLRDKNRANRLMSDCMTNHGWVAKKMWYQF